MCPVSLEQFLLYRVYRFEPNFPVGVFFDVLIIRMQGLKFSPCLLDYSCTLIRLSLQVKMILKLFKSFEKFSLFLLRLLGEGL